MLSPICHYQLTNLEKYMSLGVLMLSPICIYILITKQSGVDEHKYKSRILGLSLSTAILVFSNIILRWSYTS